MVDGRLTGARCRRHVPYPSVVRTFLAVVVVVVVVVVLVAAGWALGHVVAV